MLGKLLKHEFKQTARYVSLIYICAAVTTLVMFIAMLTKATAISVIGSSVLVFVGFLSIAFTVALVIGNFYNTLYTNRGYLSFTLPVKCSSLLISKVLVSLVWFVVSFVVCGLIYLIIFLNARAQLDGEQVGGIVDTIKESGLLEMLPSGKMIAKAVVVLIFYLFISILTFVSFVYFSLTLSNTRPLQQHPWLFGFLIFCGTYIVANTVSAWLNEHFPLCIELTEDNLKFALTSVSNSESFYSIGLGGMIFMAIAAVGMLFATGWIMEHKVNIK